MQTHSKSVLRGMLLALPLATLCLAEVKSAHKDEPDADEPNATAPHDVVVYSSGHRIPAIALTKKGTLLAFAEHRLQSSDHGNVDLVVKRSTDGGKTWGKQILVHDAGSVASGNPCPVVDRDTGIVWLGFTSNNNKLAMITRSEDDGLTWAKPTDITKQAKLDHWGWYAFGPCHGIQLKSGRLLLHGNHHCPRDKSTGDSDPRGTHGQVVYSDDHGKTWRMGGIVPGRTTGESSVTELADGSLYWNARSQGAGRRVVSRSADGGLTWSAAALDPELTEPKGSGGCQGNAIRFTDEVLHKKNRMLFCNPADPKDRKDLTVYLSYDEAKTWQKCKVVKKGSASYNDLVILPDLSIGCLYETNDGAWQRIRFARFTLDWLTEGKDRVLPRDNKKGEAESGEKPGPGDGHGVVLWGGGTRIPSIDITPRGTLLAFAQNGGGDNHPNHVEVRRSIDGGKTWDKAIDFNKDSKVKISCANPSSIVDRDTGVIRAFWAVREIGPDGLKYKGVEYCQSDDDGATWSKAKQFAVDGSPVSAGLPSTCRGIQRSSGRLLLPFTVPHSTSKWNVPRTIYSDDHGKTWHFGKEPASSDPWKHIGSSEHTMLELADGRVYMNHRHSGHRAQHRVVSFSNDGGITWTDPVIQKELLQPLSPGAGCHSGLIRLTDPRNDDKSRVLFSSPFGEGSFGRENLTIQISYDECNTWKPLKVIQTGNASYSNLIVLPDNTIGCIYEFNDLQQKIWQRIMFRRFTLEWLTDGKDKIVVKKP